ncbi:vacuolar DHA amino acid exporter [Dichomitus squalens LYAD-421 SS1]|uniref:Vacuolar DHA amino acid exporter n=1 Tax=Dichomitus squalens (strain LYAD-421) TaxID=732165 RepID=R7SZ56_DICSQ|nr:vacuolar DHA amino acid exporter [Dichomitus squalens LYAD-421 SS1]EJF61025.1 vacuolar DHA amino acid exporter [Dichomitus squalens LYAD-421 SS1]
MSHEKPQANSAPAIAIADIEHALVVDDPREWSRSRKWCVLATVSAASVVAGLSGTMYNPALSQVQEQLHASSSALAWSLSLFILLQGTLPLVWSALSEFWGRKKVYLVSTALCTIGCIVAALSKTIDVLIGMRCIQALGSSAVMSLGAATLADIYEPHERGTMMGIYYSAPLLGPSLGPILGGILTQAFSWRATFWFIAIFTGACFLLFIPFRDTYRRERSLTYQAALKRRRAIMSAKGSESSSITQVAAISRAITPKPENPSGAYPGDAKKDAIETLARERDLEKQQMPPRAVPTDMDDLKLTIADVNPAKPLWYVLRRINNLVILVASGLIFGLSYCIAYTCSRTLANEYGYNALKIGLVLLSFGAGCLGGSIFGGRYSDYVFRKLKARNGGVSAAEMRLESTIIFMPLLPAATIGYGWVCERHVNVAAICVLLFLTGLFLIAIYSSTLAYIVDANTGRSSSAVASNSCFRGTTAFIAAEVAVPLQDAIGDGGLYSLWAGLMIFANILILLVLWKGEAWRRKWEVKEAGGKRSVVTTNPPTS